MSSGVCARAAHCAQWFTQLLILLVLHLNFGFWEWTPSIGRKVGIPRGILPHVQTRLTNWNPDDSLSLPGFTNWNPDNCPGKGGIRPVLF